ncbi:MAG: hypothetical protein ACYDDT_00155 [Sulfuricella sp.]
MLAFFAPGIAMADAQPDFSPPPVPEFMLHKSAKPLTVEEMKKQADQAAEKAKAEKAAAEKAALEKSEKK